MKKRARTLDAGKLPDQELKKRAGSTADTAADITDQTGSLEAWQQLACAERARGDNFSRSFDFGSAVTAYTRALKVDPSDAVSYAGRSVAHASLGAADESLRDARECVRLRPMWAEGYIREGGALFAMHELDAAEAAYNKGQQCYPIDPAEDGTGGDESATLQNIEAAAERRDLEANSTSGLRLPSSKPAENHWRGDAHWEVLALGLQRVASVKRERLLKERAEQQRDVQVTCRDAWLFGG